MNTVIKKYLLSTFAIASISALVPTTLMAETIGRSCPYSCRTIGRSHDTCSDYRRGDTCYVVLKDGAKNNGKANNPRSNSSNGVQRVCVTNAGKIITRNRCSASETTLTAALIPTYGDIRLAGLPSGQTVYGVVGQSLSGLATQSLSSSSSINAVIPAALGINDVIVASSSELTTACGTASNCLSSEELSVTASCTGNSATPTAPAGKLCIYPTTVNNASQIRAVPIPESSGSTGVSLGWVVNADGVSTVRGVWAYTAP